MPAPVKIPFPLSSAPGVPGVRTHAGTGRLKNCYAEPRDDPDWPVLFQRSPGLVNFGTTGQTGYRGSVEIDNVLYSAFDGVLRKHSSAGGADSAVGSLPGDHRVFFAYNNKSPTRDKVVVDPFEGVATFTTSSVSTVYDVDLPVVNSVCEFKNYFAFTTGAGALYASGLNDVTQDAASFDLSRSNPDGLLRAIPYGERLYAMGFNAIDVYTDEGLSPFPFQRSTTIPVGLKGRYAVAGHEIGFRHGVLFVAHDNTVRRLTGYDPQKVSPPDLDALISAVADPDTLMADVFVARGHAFWMLSSPTWSFVFDLNNDKWHERDSYLQERSRIAGTAFAFEKWLCGDTQTGNIQRIIETAQDEVGSPLRARIESGAVSKFPVKSRVARADFNFVTGVGIATGTDPIQTDPTVEISWSRDGGQTWSNPVPRKLGRQGVAGKGVRVNGAGIATMAGHRWRLDVSDPVYFGFLGGTQSETM